MTKKPTVLLLGGCGFIGRNLVVYLLEHDFAAEVRVVDKTPPQMAWLNEKQTRAFESETIEFFSANLISSDSCRSAFAPSKKSGRSWDIVINCAAETRPNQAEVVYKEGIHKLSVNCATEANWIEAKYIELSSGCVHSSEKTPQAEDCKCDPWTNVARQKLKVEKALQDIGTLNWTIVRLPVVYGVGDKRHLMPRVIIAAIYKHLQETMKLLWNEGMYLNTVHVSDVCAAIWELSLSPWSFHETFNIVDDSDSTQGSISDILADIFGIEVDYFGVIKSNLTKLSLSDTVSEINDKHLVPWAHICQQNGIENTPLTPYLDEEQLHHKHLRLDNFKLKSHAFELRVPWITRDHVMEVIEDYVRQGLFPPLSAL